MLRQLLQRLNPDTEAPKLLSVALGSGTVTIALKRHATAKRFVLRLARDGESFVLTLPKRQSIAAAKSFVATCHGWMEKTLAKRAPKVSLSDGLMAPLRGVDYRIIATGGRRGAVTEDAANREIHVPGDQPHVKRRLTDWLKKQAEHDLISASRHYAQLMGCSYSQITVRDQKSRWGSCSSRGQLSYSWRLILAPPHVLDYVAAHEVAHLREMNHGPRFWRLVLTHCKKAGEAKRWLKANGHTLHRYV